MKISRFNYILYYGDFGYWFNSLTKSYFRLPKSISLKIENLMLNISDLKTDAPIFFNKLKDNGFIINENIDEIQIIRNNYHKFINKKDYMLVILPTLNCNVHCWYCIQKHIPSKMDLHTFNNIKNHIKHMIQEEKISSLRIEWFGGEPLLHFKDIINPLSKFAINECQRYGIPYFTSCTTNGILLNKDVRSHLSAINLNYFQITLDGIQKIHDSIKFNKSIDSAFETTLNNISATLKLNQDCIISLRINYTHETQDINIVDEIDKFIPHELRKRITVHLKKVWQEEVSLNSFDTYIEILNKFNEHGYNANFLDIATDFVPCYVNRKFYNTISYDGTVHKCTASSQLYDKEYYGLIDHEGKIDWMDEFDKLHHIPSFENERCLSCKELPLCMGICPREQIKGEQYCRMEQTDIDISKAIIAFINSKYSVS